MAVSDTTMQIFVLFQQVAKSGDFSLVSHLSYEEIRQADIEIGTRDLNSPARKAIQTQMNALEEKKDKAASEKIHNENKIMWVVGILVMLLIAFITWIFK